MADRGEAETSCADWWNNAVATHDPQPFVDETCWDRHGSTSEAWRCMDHTSLMFDHITTPYFVRQDLGDMGWPAEALALPEDEHEVAVAATLAALADVPTKSYEADAIDVAPGAYGPNCAQHVAMEMDDWWRCATVESGGTAYTFQDAVYAWYLGRAIAVVDDPVTGAGDGPRSVCSAVDGQR